VIVRGYALPQVAVDGVRTRLYPHQAAMLDEWNRHGAFLLVTKTGSGKTRATALPVLKNHESAVFVYPTNALIQDQARAIRQLMEDEGIAFQEWTPQNATEKFGIEEYVLVQVNADVLGAFAKAWGMGAKQRGFALLRLLQQDKRKIVLMNPDILFLLYSLSYQASPEALTHLQAYKTLIFDEFHLYGGVELAHALFLIYLARRTDAFPRVVLLSATPNAEVQTYLERLLAPRIIDPSVISRGRICGERPVAHDVTLQSLPVTADIVKTAQAKVIELADKFRGLREINGEANAIGGYVPCVVILNSVVNAIALEDALVEAGFQRADMAPIRGLSARSSRDVRGKTLVLGTSAIEVGIDFQADYLIFEAGDAASFMQRFGRIGRHRKGVAFLLGDHHQCQAVISLGAELSRDALERGISAIYPQRDARAWFVDSFSGAFTVIAQADNFRRRIMDDRTAGEAMKAKIDAWLDETLETYAAQMHFSQMRRARGKARRKPLWLEHYKEIDSFRTSLPSQEVWDVREKGNSRDWCYDADVKTLLTRAKRLWFNEKHGRLYVKGYGQYRRVWFAKSFEDEREGDCCGILRSTSEYSSDEMRFVQEGHLTSVSHVMARPMHHVFVLAPREIASLVDWRTAWFHCGSPHGRYIIAFDGDALLLKELYERWKSSA
jgi:CRISPR-associated helicase Cas3